MSAARAAVAVPNALGFARTAMRELVRDRYRIEKLRFDLDDEGRGEILYRLVGGGWTFHFFLVSQKLDEAQKTDRNFAASWDAMGVLCQGAWTDAREAYLRREVPKQRAGFADYDTLVYARGNRSARLFDAIVESLAAGRQPDLALVAPVGYILRTTAFIGNGQLGTRPYEGYEPGHPLRRPYHAQFCSAFLLREYVFDLVDHLARVRSPGAVRLAPAYRRYLGLGNAAATGLVPFVVNHPHLMHRWCEVVETALAHAANEPAAPVDDVVTRFAALAGKAARHYAESAHPGDGVFAPPQAIAGDLERVRDVVAAFPTSGTIDGESTDTPWLALRAWAGRTLHAEAAEVVDAMILEVHPDVVADAADAFHADERFDAVPQARVSELRDLVHRDYGWALDGAFRDLPAEHFWYRTRKAPRDVRRGVRGRDEDLELETSMDTVLQVQRLAACLDAADREATVADLLVERPDLRHIVTRVQSLVGLPYAELREHWLAGDFSPFAPVRFALTFFGLSKFEAARPKSVRGTFMQGAPIAEDVERGIDGDWPWPLMPVADDANDETLLAPLPVSRHDAERVATEAADPSSRMLAPRELARMAQNALQGHGASLGVAEDASALVAEAQALGEPAVATLLRHCAAGKVSRESRVTLARRDDGYALLHAHGASALLAAPSALDLAAMFASRSAAGAGCAAVDDATDPWLVEGLALRAALRGLVGLVVWECERLPGTASYGITVAGPGRTGPWLASGASTFPAALHTLLDARSASSAIEFLRFVGAAPSNFADAFAHAKGMPRPARSAFAVACVRVPGSAAGDALVGELVRRDLPLAVATGAALHAQDELRRRQGIPVLADEFDALAQAGAELYVDETREPGVLREGANPLRVF
jgi:hypothetical protein